MEELVDVTLLKIWITRGGGGGGGSPDFLAVNLVDGAPMV